MGEEGSLDEGGREDAVAVHFSRVQASSSRDALATQVGTMWMPSLLRKETTPGSSPAQKR